MWRRQIRVGAKPTRYVRINARANAELRALVEARARTLPVLSLGQSHLPFAPRALSPLPKLARLQVRPMSSVAQNGLISPATTPECGSTSRGACLFLSIRSIFDLAPNPRQTPLRSFLLSE